MRFAALIVAVVLGACVPEAPRQDVSLIWNPTVGMAATSRFNAQRFSGNWVVRGAFPNTRQVQSFAFIPPTTGRIGSWREVRRVGGEAKTFDALMQLDQTGVFTLLFDDVPQQMVVLWVDEGFRTAAIASRDGRYAGIFDRSSTGGADRIEAARVLLRKNGFDVSKLKSVGS